jgi:cell fate (sporulation/competence/biofilm development) regulator YlbF (YheA/YmcA/DUF963 family)
MRKKIIKQIFIGTAITIGISSAFAQGVASQPPATVPATAPIAVPVLQNSAPGIPPLPPLTVFTADAAILQSQGCLPEVMNNLNAKYMTDRTLARNQEYTTQVLQQAINTPKPSSTMDCFQQALQNINQAIAAINSIMALFSGNVDMGAMLQGLAKMVLSAVCQEVNQVTGKISGSLTSPVTGQINSTLGGINNAGVNTGITGVGNVTVGQVTQMGGLNTSNPSNPAIPVIQSGATAIPVNIPTINAGTTSGSGIISGIGSSISNAATAVFK